MTAPVGAHTSERDLCGAFLMSFMSAGFCSAASSSLSGDVGLIERRQEVMHVVSHWAELAFWSLTIAAAPPRRTEHRVTAVALPSLPRRTAHGSGRAENTPSEGQSSVRRTSVVFSAFPEECGGCGGFILPTASRLRSSRGFQTLTVWNLPDSARRPGMVLRPPYAPTEATHQKMGGLDP